uniref:Uncharacterized protein n=1 Tax=Arundo donax TaxID=35708 RepID=A0A0A9H756_ARUDO
MTYVHMLHPYCEHFICPFNLNVVYPLEFKLKFSHARSRVWSFDATGIHFHHSYYLSCASLDTR